MEKKSRTDNSIKNIVYGLISQFCLLILNFVGRTVFIRYLSFELLGLNGLFTNILSVLSLVELGFGNAIIYSLYKPIAKKDYQKISMLLNFYKKVYIYVGSIVLVIGFLLIPFLDHIINVNTTIPNIKLYYILFLLNSGVSYFYAYKISLIMANQQNYIIKLYTTISFFVQVIVQICILIFLKNYLLYLITQIFFTIITNFLLSKKADKMFPYLVNNIKLPKSEKNIIISNSRDLFIFKISGVIINNTDYILISIMIGIVTVGYYSNYNLVTMGLTSIMNIFFNSITASVGNLNATSSSAKSKKFFEYLVFISFWLFGITSICLYFLFNDFINIWVGNKFILTENIVLIIVLNYYIVGNLNPIWLFRDTTGLFKETKVSSIILAILNIVLSILLGKFWGLFGILFATAISRLLTNVWYQPYMLYKKVFKENVKKYFLDKLFYLFVISICMFIINLFSKYIVVSNWLSFIFKGTLLFFISNIIFILFFFKNKNFIYVFEIIYDKILLIFKKRLNKHKKIN